MEERDIRPAVASAVKCRAIVSDRERRTMPSRGNTRFVDSVGGEIIANDVRSQATEVLIKPSVAGVVGMPVNGDSTARGLL